MAPSRSLAALGVAVVALLAASRAGATVLTEVPIDDMAFAADAIVLGEVVRVGTKLDLSGDRPEPWTAITIRVDRWIWGGDGQRTVLVEERGGEVQGLAMRIDGTPRYAEREQVLVFLRRDDQGRMRTYGMAQGKLTLLPALDGTIRARRDLGEIAFARWQDGQMRVEHAPVEPAMRLDALLARIARVLEARR